MTDFWRKYGFFDSEMKPRYRNIVVFSLAVAAWTAVCIFFLQKLSLLSLHVDNYLEVVTLILLTTSIAVAAGFYQSAKNHMPE